LLLERSLGVRVLVEELLPRGRGVLGLGELEVGVRAVFLELGRLPRLGEAREHGVVVFELAARERLIVEELLEPRLGLRLVRGGGARREEGLPARHGVDLLGVSVGIGTGGEKEEEQGGAHANSGRAHATTNRGSRVFASGLRLLFHPGDGVGQTFLGDRVLDELGHPPLVAHHHRVLEARPRRRRRERSDAPVADGVVEVGLAGVVEGPGQPALGGLVGVTDVVLDGHTERVEHEAGPD
ncbi:MAG: hypothetical protein ACK55I_47710, partial [bacterium]